MSYEPQINQEEFDQLRFRLGWPDNPFGTVDVDRTIWRRPWVVEMEVIPIDKFRSGRPQKVEIYIRAVDCPFKKITTTPRKTVVVFSTEVPDLAGALDDMDSKTEIRGDQGDLLVWPVGEFPVVQVRRGPDNCIDYYMNPGAWRACMLWARSLARGEVQIPSHRCQEAR